MNWDQALSEVDEALAPSPQETAATQVRARIRELAKLNELDYELRRDNEARALGIRVSVLDTEVAKARETPTKRGPDPFEELVAWPEAVVGAKLLEEIRTTINRFCVLPEHSDVLIAVWVVHAHAHDCADISPILCLTSPEKRCGKSTAASVIASLVPRPMHTINVTPAVMFRVVEAHKPTLVIDEGDSFLQDNEDMRNLLNGGHDRRTAYVWRSTGDAHEPTQFNVWAPKVLAMIGRPPDTIIDRSIMVHLRRKQPGECVDRFSVRLVGTLRPLAQQVARWVADNRFGLSDADPEIPQALNDRAQDNARALCAIADLAGGRWPSLLRAALVGSVRQDAEDEPQSPAVMLLTDIQEILEHWTGNSIGSTDLLQELLKDSEGPWVEWRRGEPITTRGIAKLLAPFGIKPTRDRARRFYRVADFEDAIVRYLQ